MFQQVPGQRGLHEVKASFTSISGSITKSSMVVMVSAAPLLSLNPQGPSPSVLCLCHSFLPVSPPFHLVLPFTFVYDL